MLVYQRVILYLSVPKCGNSISGWWFQPPLKYICQIGSSSQLLGKIKFMFQTTNQISCVSCLLLSTDFLTLCGLLGPVLLLHWSAPSHRCALMLSKGLKDTGTQRDCVSLPFSLYVLYIYIHITCVCRVRVYEYNRYHTASQSTHMICRVYNIVCHRSHYIIQLVMCSMQHSTSRYHLQTSMLLSTALTSLPTRTNSKHAANFEPLKHQCVSSSSCPTVGLPAVPAISCIAMKVNSPACGRVSHTSRGLAGCSLTVVSEKP